MTQALRAGFRGIDTACQPKHYNEPGVGAGVAAALHIGLHGGPGAPLTRADLFLQTKFTAVSGQDPASIPYDPRATLPEQVAQSCAISLQNLRTDYLDSLVLHSPLSTQEQTFVVWQAMEALVDGGSVRQLGISNCYQLHWLTAIHGRARIKPAVLQNRFHAETGYDRAIRAFCLQHSISYQSFWTLTANPQILAHPAVARIAAVRGRTPAQILFRLLAHIGVVPLTGTRSATHMLEDLRIFEFELDPAERAAIEALLQA